MAENIPETVEIEQPAAGEASAVHDMSWVSRRPRRIYAGMWGPAEIAVVAIGTLAVFGAIIVYAVFVLPSDRELAKNRSEADRLDAEQMSANSKYGDITNTQSQVSKLVSSVDDFEMHYLPLANVGQPALYQKINGLIASHDLTNTTGPDYAPLEVNDEGKPQQTDEEKGRAKFRSLYPGVYVTTTLEGTYQNLRRFIRDVETGNDFIVISAIELTPSDTEGQKSPETTPAANANVAKPGTVTTQPAPVTRPQEFERPDRFGNPNGFGPSGGFGQQQQQQGRNAPKEKRHGEVVSLHIEMAAYFRRPRLMTTTAQ